MGWIIPILFLSLLISGCGSDGADSNNSEVTTVTLMDKGASVPNPVSTTVRIDSQTIHLLQQQSGETKNEWSNSIQSGDFVILQQVISDHRLMESADVLPGSNLCTGWNGMTVTLEKGNITHVINVSGVACSRDWPEGIQELLTTEATLLQKYQP